MNCNAHYCQSEIAKRVKELRLLWTLSAQQFGISIAVVAVVGVVVVGVAFVASAAVVLFMSFVMFLQIFLCK